MSREPEWIADNDEALAALVNLIVVLADNKYYLGRYVSEWSVGAPSMEDSIGCAAIAQEELGHARALYPLLDDLPFDHGPEPLEREEDRARRYCVSFLDERFPTWSHVVAALVLIDTAVYTVLEGLRDSRYGKLKARVGRMPAEEAFHMQFAEGRVREMRLLNDGTKQLQQRVDELFGEMLCWFGPPHEAGVDALVTEGLLRTDNEQMRRAYMQRVVPLLLEAGVRAPVQWDLAEARWSYEGELPWDRWNALQRRLVTHAVPGEQ